MSRIIHARLDDEVEKMLVKLQRRSGWSDSQVVREGIRALSALIVSKGKRKIIGLGAFSSGHPDLGSNKKHLSGFGK